MRKKAQLLLALIIIVGLIAASIFLTSFAQQSTLSTVRAGEKERGWIAELTLPENLVLSSPEKTFKLSPEELAGGFKNLAVIQVLNPRSLKNYFYEQTGTAPLSTQQTSYDIMERLVFDEPALGQYLLGLANETNQSPEDAELVIERGQATKFHPHQDGLTLDLAKSRNLIAKALLAKDQKVILPILVTPPKTRLGNLNTLGIEEILATGQTDFSGSSAFRIQNIRVGSQKYNGVIIDPGEEFSFNKHLGPIDAAHGYKPELVIKPEGTVPEFGGGLCQVSSTAFRAAFFAGLPITARRNHSYAVRYYQWIADDRPRAVGLDATIYPGAQDLKFVNNTPGAVLVWTRIEGKKLYFDFYGSPDGRTITVDGPHEYDRQVSGAVKAEVKRRVANVDGTVQEDVFKSRYVSPNLYPKIYEFPKPPSTPSSPPPEVNN